MTRAVPSSVDDGGLFIAQSSTCHMLHRVQLEDDSDEEHVTFERASFLAAAMKNTFWTGHDRTGHLLQDPSHGRSLAA